jgi:hypothetical protein
MRNAFAILRDAGQTLVRRASRVRLYLLIVQSWVWRRGWDSNSHASNGFCNLQILKCHGCRRCRRCRGALPAIARRLSSSAQGSLQPIVRSKRERQGSNPRSMHVRRARVSRKACVHRHDPGPTMSRNTRASHMERSPEQHDLSLGRKRDCGADGRDAVRQAESRRADPVHRMDE